MRPMTWAEHYSAMRDIVRKAMALVDSEDPSAANLAQEAMYVTRREPPHRKRDEGTQGD